MSLREITNSEELDFVHEMETGLEEESAPVIKRIHIIQGKQQKILTGISDVCDVSTLLRITEKKG